MESVSPDLVVAVLLIVGAIVLVLWVQNLTEKTGIDSRAGRLSRLGIILSAVFAIYYLLSRR